jgi:hypothetical protein
MLGHEVDGLRSNFFGGNDQIPFIFPVFVVDQDNELPFLNISDGVFNVVERRRHRATNLAFQTEP